MRKTPISKLMPPPHSWLLCCLFAFWIPSLVKGDGIWIKGSDQPIFGQIVAADHQEVQVLVFENGEWSNQQSISRQTIELTVKNFDEQRLSRLSPADPHAYRNYAEELAVQSKDPAAKQLARRLFLLAAALAENEDTDNPTEPGNESSLQQGALRGLEALTDKPEELRRITILRHLLDPNSTRHKSLSTAERSTIPRSKNDDQLMLELVQAIRQERSAEARTLLAKEENRRSFLFWKSICSLEELERMARVNRATKVGLHKLLMIELSIRLNRQPKQTSQQKNDWGYLADKSPSSLGAIPSFANVTEFSPTKSVYRNGTWTEPSAN